MKYRCHALVVAFVAAFAAAPARAAEVEKYLPADTEAVLHVNLRQTIDSPLAKKYLLEQLKKALKDNAEASRALEAIGLDPLKDLSGLTVAVSEKVAEGKVFAVAHGAFNVDKITAAVEAEGKKSGNEFKSHDLDGNKVYEMKGKNAQTVFASFPNKETLIVASSKEYVADSLRNAKGTPAVSKDLQALLKGVDDKQNMWMVARVPDTVKQLLASQPQTMAIAEKLKAIVGGVSVTDGLQLDIEIQTSEAAAAAQVSQLLEGVKGLAAFAGGGDPNVAQLIADVVGATKIGTKDKAATINIKLTGAMIEKAAGKVKRDQ